MRTVTRYALSDVLPELPVVPMLPVLPVAVLLLVLPWRGNTSMRVTTLLAVPVVVTVGPLPVMVPVVELMDVSWPAVALLMPVLPVVAMALVSPLVPVLALVTLAALVPMLPDGDVLALLL